MKAIRAFIAIHVTSEIKEHLATISQELARRAPAASVRWVKPEAMHLTLIFLGDTAVDRLPAIYDALDTVTASQPAFTLTLDRLGSFPNDHRPRVIWAGLRDPAGRAQSLKTALDDALQPLGIEPERRPYHLHLTLGRVKEGQTLTGMDYGRPLEPLNLPVQAIHLIESQLRPDGPLYTIRHSSRLG